MKNFFKKLAVFLAIVGAVSATVNIVKPEPTHASCRYFLGMTSWDCNLAPDVNSQDKLITNIVKIATNILTDVTVLAAYLVVGYVIYGGYLYMFSSGDAGKAAAGKKTLTNAFIGLAIVISAYTIFGAIRIALIGDANLSDCNPTTGTECIDGNAMVTNLIQWVAGMGGVVSAVFIVVGGWGYMTSAGDPGKLEKAKKTLLYAIIGLIIVALAEVLTAFVSNIVREANDNAYLDQSTTAQIINTKENT